jgi:hypothetical protein
MDTLSYFEQLATFVERWRYAILLGVIGVIGVGMAIRMQRAKSSKRRPW